MIIAKINITVIALIGLIITGSLFLNDVKTETEQFNSRYHQFVNASMLKEAYLVVTEGEKQFLDRAKLNNLDELNVLINNMHDMLTLKRIDYNKYNTIRGVDVFMIGFIFLISLAVFFMSMHRVRKLIISNDYESISRDHKKIKLSHTNILSISFFAMIFSFSMFTVITDANRGLYTADLVYKLQMQLYQNTNNAIVGGKDYVLDYYQFKSLDEMRQAVDKQLKSNDLLKLNMQSEIGLKRMNIYFYGILFIFLVFIVFMNINSIDKHVKSINEEFC